MSPNMRVRMQNILPKSTIMYGNVSLKITKQGKNWYIPDEVTDVNTWNYIKR
jgi:hypothetical protein